MKVSEAWLAEWVNLPLSGAKLAEQLTMAGLEVDHVLPVAGVFDHVIVARVRDTTPHPQADRLTLCTVDVGAGSLRRVVCGASNVRAGLIVALALPGAHLPGDILIKESTLRGELSQGMLCSSSELGFDDGSTGILELPDNAPIGMDLREYLVLDDQVHDLDLTPNRADCFSVRGVARELSVLNHVPLRTWDVPSVSSMIERQCSVHVLEPRGCPAYAVRVLQGINPSAVTPIWIKERLRRAGMQSIHPVVDVANYVMLDVGQPMHVFDLNAIKGDVHVRMAHAGESLTLLGEQTVSLDERVLVIADDHQAHAMAGVMGGLASAVHADSVDLLLESAFFNPLTIAGVARRYGLSSDASQRFERGVDPHLHQDALEYATTLLMSIVGGKAGPVTYVRDPEHFPSSSMIAFHPNRVAQLTGVIIPEAEMLRMLEGLGMQVSCSLSEWMIQVPSHRFDITLEVDLVEEMIRLYGYDRLEDQPIVVPMKAGIVHPVQQRLIQVGSYLSHRGYHESISYSFVDPALQRLIYPDAEVMSLANPISSELSEMRAGLWVGLIASLLHNVHRQQAMVKCFETGVIFERNGTDINESVSFAGVVSGESGALSWNEPTRGYDFYDMKGDIQSLFLNLKMNASLRFVADVHPALHPGQSARLLLGDIPIGWMGILHPRLVDAFDLTRDVMLFEVSLTPLLTTDSSVRYQRISKYPQIRRDLSLLVDDAITVDAIERIIYTVVPGAPLKTIDVFDQYKGATLPLGKKSIAIALTLQHEDRTLVDVEINQIISAILEKLDKELNIVLRD